MNKWRGSVGAKFAAWVGITLSAILFLASAVGAIAIWEGGVYEYASEKAYRKAMYEVVAENYAVRVLEQMNSGKTSDFEDAHLRYGIIPSDHIDGLDFNDESIYIESNFTEKVSPEDLYVASYEVDENTYFSYSTGLFGGYSAEIYTPDLIEVEEIYDILYQMDEGIFYYETSGGFYPVHKVELTCPFLEERKNYTFVYDFDTKMYRNENIVEAADVLVDVGMPEEKEYVIKAQEDRGIEKERQENIESPETLYDVLQSEYITFDMLADTGWTQENWGELRIDNISYKCDGSEIRWSNNSSFNHNEVITEIEYEADENGMLYVKDHAGSEDRQSYSVVIQLPKQVDMGLSSDLFVQASTFATIAYRLRYAIYALLFAFLVTGICCFVFLLNASGHRKNTNEIVTTWIDRMPFDIYLGISGLIFFVICLLILSTAYSFAELPGFILFVMLVVVAGWVLLLSFLTFAVRIKCGKWWKNTVLWWILSRLYHILWTIFSNLSLLWKAILMIGVLLVVEFLNVSWDGIGRITTFWFFERILLVPVILLAIVQMQKLKRGAERMADGDLEHRIDTEKMFWEFRRHGETLNSISVGMSRAVDERMKSERFKTELITNVSHDIKTPLTCIINYVDLLEKQEIQNETTKEYIEVLERQSARLKKLIEDLMEASKASTGNLAVNIEELEVGVSLVQIVGEFDEKMKENGLELLIVKQEKPIYILADSRHFWRVIDNLMNNICKYAQQGTRVYINLEEQENEAVLTFRNTSKYPLNISSEELMERFVRGDSSRNTEGSGLGLSIAKSLMELMEGTFALYVDGDLFKVELCFRKKNNNIE